MLVNDKKKILNHTSQGYASVRVTSSETSFKYLNFYEVKKDGFNGYKTEPWWKTYGLLCDKEFKKKLSFTNQ